MIRIVRFVASSFPTLSLLLALLLTPVLAGVAPSPALAWQAGAPISTLSDDQSCDTFWQVGTLEGLLTGLYDGVAPLSEVIEHGDLGLGTFDRLDGEMILLNGHIWQAHADGRVALANPKDTTPFACATYFSSDAAVTLHDVQGLTDLQTRLAELMPGRNLPCAFKVTGVFSYVKTRSVPPQQKPYPPLSQVTKHQPTFEKTEVRGTVVGFYLPTSMARLNATGFHLHFLADDRSIGGHLLDARGHRLQAEVDITPHLSVDFPLTDAFQTQDLEPERAHEIKAVEQ